MDDVGWADFNYNTEVKKSHVCYSCQIAYSHALNGEKEKGKKNQNVELLILHPILISIIDQAESPIPTPNIDKLAKSG